MELRQRIRKSMNALENSGTRFKIASITPNKGIKYMHCPACQLSMKRDAFLNNAFICPDCGHNLRMTARERIDQIIDAESFEEFDENLSSINFLDFPKYDEKLEIAQKKTGEKEAVITGTAKVDGRKTALFVMNSFFMMGSMGSVVGEKITRIFEYATREKLPVIGICASGGARMQEGITSLLQMAKVSMAVKNHSEAGLLYVAVLTDPTTGGVMASFAMEGDIIISEPKALLGFAGQRVIESTIRKKLPENFQKAELILEQGFLDAIVPRKELSAYLGKVLMIHGY